MNFLEDFEEVVGFDLLQHCMHPQSKITLQPEAAPRFRSVSEELTWHCTFYRTEMCQKSKPVHTVKQLCSQHQLLESNLYWTN